MYTPKGDLIATVKEEEVEEVFDAAFLNSSGSLVIAGSTYKWQVYVYDLTSGGYKQNSLLGLFLCCLVFHPDFIWASARLLGGCNVNTGWVLLRIILIRIENKLARQITRVSSIFAHFGGKTNYLNGENLRRFESGELLMRIANFLPCGKRRSLGGVWAEFWREKSYRGHKKTQIILIRRRVIRYPS